MAASLPLPEHLRIYPSRLAIAAAVRRCGRDAVFTADATTFAELLRSLGSLGGRRYASPLVAHIMTRAVMLDTPGWPQSAAHDAYDVRAVQRALAELRGAGITAERLAGGSEALCTLAAMLAGYECALDAAGLADDADWERLGVLAAAQGRLPSHLRELRSVSVEGGGSLFGARADLLRALAARGVRVEIRMPWDSDRAAAFGWPDASMTLIETLGMPAEVTHDARVGAGPLAPLRVAQFSRSVVDAAPVTLLHAASRAEHVRAVAERVAAWLREGVPPDEIAVATPSLDELGPLLVRELGGAGVPAVMRRGLSLAESVAGRVLTQALRLPASAFPREETLEVWRALDRAVESKTGRIAAAEAAHWVRQAGTRSQRLLGYREALLVLARQSEKSSRGLQAPAAHAIADALESLMQVLSGVPERADLLGQLAACEEAVKALKLAAQGPGFFPGDPDGAHEHRRELLVAEGQQAEAVAELSELLFELRLAARAAEPKGEWTRDELADLVALLIKERRLSPRGLSAGAVGVHSIEEMVEARFRRVALVGIDVEVFPRPPRLDRVLHEELRIEINRRLGPKLLQSSAVSGRGALSGDARDSWLWLEALAAADEALLISYTTLAGDDTGRSTVVDELLRSLGGPQVEVAAPSYAAAATTSRSRLLARWSLLSLRRGATIADAGDLGLAQELGSRLRAVMAERMAYVERRVGSEQELRARGRMPFAPEDLAQLSAHFVERAHNASRLDLLGACRFRYFAAALLRLRQEDVPSLGADARDEGNAGHAALHRVYDALRARGGLTWARSHRKEAMGLAHSAFTASADDILRQVVIHPALRGAVLEDVWVVVETQLAADLADGAQGEAIAFEHAFHEGEDAPPALVVKAPDGEREVVVNGSIDRVDRVGDCIVCIDYKRTPEQRPAGRHFQLPLYALVGLRDFGGATIRAAWVGLRDAKRLPVEDLPNDPIAAGEQVRVALWGRVDEVTHGNVQPDPYDRKLCERCDYAALCRFDAERELGAEDDT